MLSKIALNANVLSSSYKRLTSDGKSHRLKVKGWKKIFYQNRNNKKWMKDGAATCTRQNGL